MVESAFKNQALISLTKSYTLATVYQRTPTTPITTIHLDYSLMFEYPITLI